jgi:CIC family chloride channel protein
MAATLARHFVVRFAPAAAGTGIQNVKAYIRGKVPAGSPAIIPVKFFGGILAIGSGLALGREGPTVQRGARIGPIAAKALVKEEADRPVVAAACAGAGLAVAFNAPVGGSVFVFDSPVAPDSCRTGVCCLRSRLNVWFVQPRGAQN